jgi:hypothetical protein
VAHICYKVNLCNLHTTKASTEHWQTQQIKIMIMKNYFHCDHQYVFHRKRLVFFFFLSPFFFKLIYKGIIKNLLELFLYLRAFGKILTIFFWPPPLIFLGIII